MKNIGGILWQFEFSCSPLKHSTGDLKKIFLLFEPSAGFGKIVFNKPAVCKQQEKLLGYFHKRMYQDSYMGHSVSKHWAKIFGKTLSGKIALGLMCHPIYGPHKCGKGNYPHNRNVKNTGISFASCPIKVEHNS